MSGDFIGNLVRRSAGIIPAVHVQPAARTYFSPYFDPSPLPNQVRGISKDSESTLKGQEMDNPVNPTAVSSQLENFERTEKGSDTSSSGENIYPSLRAQKLKSARGDYGKLDFNLAKSDVELTKEIIPENVKPVNAHKSLPSSFPMNGVVIQADTSATDSHSIGIEDIIHKSEYLEKIDIFDYPEKTIALDLDPGSGAEKRSEPYDPPKTQPVAVRYYPVHKLSQLPVERDEIEAPASRETEEIGAGNLKTSVLPQTLAGKTSKVVLQKMVDNELSEGLPVIKPATNRPSPVPIKERKSIANNKQGEVETREIHVNIGAIEIRAETQPAVEPVPQARTYGFDEFAMIRRYQGWER